MLKRTTILAITLLASSLIGRADAGLIFTNYTGEEVLRGAIVEDTLGTEFTVGATDLLVTRLGVYDADGDGLSLSHQVGIWRVSDQSLVASALVPAGTAATLVEDWRFVALGTTTTLTAGTIYRVGAFETRPAEGDPFMGTFSLGEGIASATPGSVFSTGSFAYPSGTNAFARVFANVDVTAVVPEPASITLLGLGTLGLLAYSFRRSTASI
jgi:hypothetical protein